MSTQLIKLIDNAIDDLKHLSVPIGYSDSFFAFVLSSYYDIRENLSCYESDKLFPEVLSTILMRVEFQHEKLRRDEGFWKKEYNVLESKYEKWTTELKKRYCI